jgi:hypothetical protein
MKIVNVHQRLLHADPQRVAALIATLGSPGDQLWPRTGWPRMVLDRPLEVGATGGHGPIRYTCDAYEPASLARFRFKRSNGWHQFEILDATRQHCVLEHRTEVDARGRSLLLWLLVVRPLHDACVEDLLSQAQASLGEQPRAVRWSPYVRLLVRWFSRRFSRYADRSTRRPHAA